MRVSLLVAISENRVIGVRGGLPWRLPKDLQRFKDLTMGHAIVMGRRTYDSIGRPLPGRRSVVLSRDLEFRLSLDHDAPKGVKAFGSLDEALNSLRQEDEVFVIGGGSVFAEAHIRAERLYLTKVHADLPGDTFFPEEALQGWVTLSKEPHPADARHAYAFTFFTCGRPGSGLSASKKPSGGLTPEPDSGDLPPP